ncbi:MAG TPA: nucleotide exchange factor GrpE [Candidatus Polarisedimenticolaceae bacterium]|nr:nucleotide exchange factor GrpE [Candidatus Polarisedimenticolaceae bacterium]
MEPKHDRELSDENGGFRVEDRRHWTRDEAGGEEPPKSALAEPGVVGELRQRAVAAEAKLQEYIEAFKAHREEQDRLRARLTRDVDRRVELQFGQLVVELLELVDDLDLALEHAGGVPEAAALSRGVALARDRFLATVERQGVTRHDPTGTPFDPNEAEAVRVDAVDDPERDGMVTATLRPGYKLGERLLRPARVAVGRAHASS